MVNLAVQQRYRDVLDAHRHRLADWCKTAGNRGMQHYARPGCVCIPGVGWVQV
jgi:DNA primase